MNQLKQYPIIHLVVPFVLGIVAQIKLNLFSNYLIYFTLLVIASVFFVRLNKRINEDYSRRWIFVPLLGFVFFLIGIIYTNLKTTHPNEILLKSENKIVTAIVIDKPVEKEKTVKTFLQIEGIQTDSVHWQSINANALAYFVKDSLALRLSIGDKVLISVQFNEVRNAGNPYEYDYKQYLASKGIHQQVYIKSDKWKLVGRNFGNPTYLLADKIRDRLLSIYRQNNISGQEFAVLAALTLGYTAEIDNETKQAFSASGTIHVLSVSGMHVGIVYMIINWLLFFLNRFKHGKIIKPCIAVVFVWFFAFISGLSACVERAALMFTIVAVGGLIKRKSHIYNNLLISGFILLLWNPLNILDIGFQLSFLAIFAIVFFYDELYWAFTFNNRISNWIWSLVCVSVAAQIGTFPITVYYFHQFPTYFLIANLIVIPLSTLILIGGIAMFPLSFIEPVGKLLGSGLHYLVKYLNLSLEFIEGLPIATFRGISIDWFQMVILFGFVLLIWHFLIHKNYQLLKWSALSLAVFLIFQNVYYVAAAKQHKLIVYNVYGSPAYNLISGKKNLLLCDSTLLKNQTKQSFYFSGCWTKLKIERAELINIDSLNNSKEDILLTNNFINFKGKKLAIIRSDDFSKSKAEHKLNVDFVVLSNNTTVSINDVTNLFSTQLIIIDSSNFLYRKDKWLAECKMLGVACYAVADNGAFVYDF